MAVQRSGEGNTGDGQFVRFWTTDETVDETKEVLKDHFSRIEIPVTHKTNVEHGWYGRYSRFDIKQVDYWAGPGGYYEVLEIQDAPDGHHPFVSHSYSVSEHGETNAYFVEWESTAAAQEALRTVGAAYDISSYRDAKEPVPGMIRAVELNLLAPWFYATGNAEITGDYVYPEYLANDPVYQVGRRFLVPVKELYSTRVHRTVLKTCMGASTQERKPSRRFSHYADETEPYLEKTIQWADGSITTLSPKTPDNLMPRAVDNEPWITEATDKIQHMLAGRSLSFTVEFADGGKFIGRFVEPKENRSDPEGSYELNISFADGTSQQGWVDSFKPTQEAPTITEKALQVYTQRGMEVSHIEILEKRTEPGGKKWKGVYHVRSTQDNKSPEDSPA